MLNWYFIALGIFAYLLGSVPAAYLAARFIRGIDLRKYGSGNVGASNLAKSASAKLAIPVFLFDIGKGYLVVFLAGLAGLDLFYQIMIGILAIVGHNWPLFLGFRGGRGIATSLGVVLAVSPWLGLIVLVMAYGLAPFKQLAVGVLIALMSLPVFSWFLPGHMGIEDRLGAVLGFTVLLTVAIVRRLVQPRAEVSRHLGRAEIIFNRLVFDRDIRDRDAWLNRQA